MLQARLSETPRRVEKDWRNLKHLKEKRLEGVINQNNDQQNPKAKNISV